MIGEAPPPCAGHVANNGFFSLLIIASLYGWFG